MSYYLFVVIPFLICRPEFVQFVIIYWKIGSDRMALQLVVFSTFFRITENSYVERIELRTAMIQGRWPIFFCKFGLLRWTTVAYKLLKLFRLPLTLCFITDESATWQLGRPVLAFTGCHIIFVSSFERLFLEHVALKKEWRFRLTWICSNMRVSFIHRLALAPSYESRHAQIHWTSLCALNLSYQTPILSIVGCLQIKFSVSSQYTRYNFQTSS